MLLLSTRTALLLLALGTIPASLALADGAPATTSSDHKTSEIDVKVTPGAIDIRNGKAEIGVGYLGDSNGGQGGTAKIDASKKYYIWGDVTDTHAVTAIRIEPSVKGQVNATSDGTKGATTKKGDLEVGGVGLGYFSATELHETPENTRKREALQERLNKNFERKRTVDSELGLLSGCVERLDAGYKDCSYDVTVRYTTNGALDIEKVRADRAARKLETSRLAAEREQLESEAKAEGFRLSECRDTRSYYAAVFPCFEPKLDESMATVDLKLTGVSGVVRKDSELGIKQQGAKLSGPEASFHIAGRFNGINADFCMTLAPVNYIVGVSQGKNPGESSGSVCGGVGLGKVGTLTHQFTGTVDWSGSYYKLTDETSLKNIGGTGLNAYHSYEVEGNTDSGAKVKRNMFGITKAF